MSNQYESMILVRRRLRMENSYLKQAKELLSAAKKEFKEGKAKGDQIKIRDAAEKGWNATVQATNGLFAKKRKPIPKSNRVRREGLEKIAPELRDRFEARAHSLHSQCFYDGVCPLEIVERDINKVGDYIDQVEKK